MNIIAFSYSDRRSASVRYRVLAPLSWMKRHHGVNVQWIFPGYQPLRVLRAIRGFLYCRFFARSKDIILIHKVYSCGIYFKMIKNIIYHTRATIIYDIDDAEWWRQPTQGMDTLMRLCDQIHVGSTQLINDLNYLQKPIAHLTSCIHPPHHIHHGVNKRFHIGWVGGYNSHELTPEFSHKNAITNLLLPALADLPFAITLTLIGPSREDDIRALQHWAATCSSDINLVIPRILNWSDEAKLDSLISQWDLGIALMIDHPFNRAKSAFKAKQYMNCGVPVIGNRVGDNEAFIIDRHTGYLTETTTEVHNALRHHYQLAKVERHAMHQACLSLSPKFHIDEFVKQFFSSIAPIINHQTEDHHLETPTADWKACSIHGERPNLVEANNSVD